MLKLSDDASAEMFQTQNAVVRLGCLLFAVHRRRPFGEQMLAQQYLANHCVRFHVSEVMYTGIWWYPRHLLGCDAV
jgi:hypothetical protein